MRESEKERYAQSVCLCECEGGREGLEKRKRQMVKDVVIYKETQHIRGIFVKILDPIVLFCRINNTECVYNVLFL